MGRTIITTCGTSLYTSSSWKDEKCFNGPALAKIPDPEERHYMGSEYAAFTARFPNAIDLAGQFVRECWDDINLIGKLSAELASLRALTHYYESAPDPPQPLGQGDTLIFIYSNNVQGKFCAACIESIIKENQLFPDVVLIFREVSGLDPLFPQEFQGALQTLWSFCRQVSENLSNRDRLIFNLTGGYKVMGLVLAALSPSILGKPSIIYLHESTAAEQLHIYYCDPDRDPLNRLVAGFYEPNTKTMHLPGALP